jgi:hypothetical protein
LLLIPMVCWIICGITAPNGPRASNRYKIIVGGFTALCVLPLLLLLVSKIWLPHEAPWDLFRTKPLEIVDHWWHGHAAPSSGNVPSVEPSGGHFVTMSRAFLAAMAKGATPWFLLLLAVGIWRGRRRCLQLELAPLWLASAALLLAIWMHLYVAEETSKRYFLPIVLMTSPLAALGLQALANVRHSSRWAPLGLFAALVGQKIAQHCETAPGILGPPGIVGLVAYYAGGQAHVFPNGATEATIETLCREDKDDVILIPTPRDANAQSNMLAWTRRDGFEPMDDAELGSGSQRIGAFVRRRKRL